MFVAQLTAVIDGGCHPEQLARAGRGESR